MSGFVPHLVHEPGEIPRPGDPLVDEYLRFVTARARHNTLLRQTFDLKVFFTIVGKTPTKVGTSDVFACIQAQRPPRILDPAEANALLGALRSERDRSMVLLTLFGGLRRCEVLDCGWAMSAPANGVYPSAPAKAGTNASCP